MFEYKLHPSNGLPTAEQLNELGEDGWEVVQIVQNSSSRDRFEYAVYLRRQMITSATH